MRILVTGWFSFRDGEATAGDLLALAAVRDVIGGLPHDVAFSPVFRDGLRLADASPERYSDLVFVCGPLHGRQIVDLHDRYSRCRRIAVGVSVVDPEDEAVTRFDHVLARDGAGTARRDLSLAGATGPVPVVAVVLTGGQGEYGARRRHAEVSGALTTWLAGKECAPLPLETRLDRNDWRLSTTADAFVSLLRRADVVVTTRLHGLVLALRHGIPAIAVDPVAGGAKMRAQARALGWPSLLPEELTPRRLDEAWTWCLSERGSRAAARRSAARPAELTRELSALLGRGRTG